MEDIKNKNNDTVNSEGNREEVVKEELKLEEKDSEETKADESNAELQAALSKINELERQVAELKEAYLRKAAEFENYKKRTENDQINIIKYAAEPFIKNILTVYDDLSRSLNHIDEENNFESLKKGLDLVYDKFSKVLESHQIKKIEAKGQPFDVDLHEALMQQQVEGVPAHIVLDVIEPGYIYKDKVIRHAKVIVSAESMNEEN